MRPALLLLALSLLLLPLPARAQRAVLFVRHAEKLDESRDALLSPAGEARARALDALLRDAGVRAIYVTELQRTAQTAAPLAKRLGITPAVVPRAEGKGLPARARREHPDDVILVVGHSDTLPVLLQSFGLREPPPIAHGEYDGVFLLVPRPPGPPVFLRLRY